MKPAITRSVILAAAIASCLAAGMVYSNDPLADIERRADSGDVAAQVDAGSRYLRALGVPADIERGLMYLEMAARDTTARKEAAAANAILAEHFDSQKQTPATKARMLRHLRQAAVLGDVRAQTRLGRMLVEAASRGDLPPESATSARNQGRGLLEHAARAGHIEAARTLASMHFTGDGLEKNETIALQWVKLAADRGDSAAGLQYGQTLLERQTDDATAWAYIKVAAQAGTPEAIGLMADNALERNDLEGAIGWAEHAAKTAAPNAAVIAGKVEKEVERRELAEAAKAAEKAEAERLAAEAAKAEAAKAEAERIAAIEAAAKIESERIAATEAAKAAQSVAIAASSNVAAKAARLAETERLTEVERLADEAEASLDAEQQAVSLAATPGAFEDVGAGDLGLNTLAADDSAGALLKQIGSLRSRIGALEEERQQLVQTNERLKAANAALRQKLDKSEAVIASLRQQGTAGGNASRIAATPSADERNRLGIEAFNERRYADAIRLFSAAAEQGHPSALNSLGTLHMRGLGTAPSPDKAVDYFTRAANAGSRSAAQNLALIYQDGMGVPQDREKARAWYRRAAELGAGGAAGSNAAAIASTR